MATKAKIKDRLGKDGKGMNRVDRNAGKKDRQVWKATGAKARMELSTDLLRRNRLTRKERVKEDVAAGKRPPMPMYSSRKS